MTACFFRKSLHSFLFSPKASMLWVNVLEGKTPGASTPLPRGRGTQGLPSFLEAPPAAGRGCQTGVKINRSLPAGHRLPVEVPPRVWREEAGDRKRNPGRRSGVTCCRAVWPRCADPVTERTQSPPRVGLGVSASALLLFLWATWRPGAGAPAMPLPQLPEGDVFVEAQAVVALLLCHVAPLLPASTGCRGAFRAPLRLATPPPALSYRSVVPTQGLPTQEAHQRSHTA